MKYWEITIYPVLLDYQDDPTIEDVESTFLNLMEEGFLEYDIQLKDDEAPE